MDNRRLLLLLVFSFSLVMLWDAWQKYNQPPPVAPTAGAVTPGSTDVAAPQPSASLHSPVPTLPGAAPAAVAQSGETFTIKTDLFVAEISAQGGDIVRLVLHDYKDTESKSKDFALFDRRHHYAAQSGLIGEGLPNHKTVFSVVPGDRELSGEAKTLFFNLSGHGHFDMAAYENYFSGNMQDFAYSDADLQKSLKTLPNVDWPPKAA